MPTRKRRHVIAILIGVVLIPGLMSPAFAQSKKLAILPFKIHSDRDLIFLQKGIVDMLTSRLGGGSDQVTLIDRQKVKDAMIGQADVEGAAAARAMGALLEADQVLYGSLTVLGETVSIDARVLEMTRKDAPTPFFSQTTAMGDLIPRIDLLARAVNRRVFGREMAPNLTTAAASPTTRAPKPAHSGRAHPEKLLNAAPGAPAAQTAPAVPAPAEAGFVSPAKDQQQAAPYWRSQSMEVLFTGLAEGDLDGDGRREIVMVSPHRLYVYRYTDGRLVQIYESARDRYRHYVGVDVADINGNGSEEVFVSALSSNRDSVQSLVLEFAGDDFTTVAEDIPWLCRVSRMTDGKPRLLGQKIKPGQPLNEPAFWLIWDGGRYSVRDQITPANAGSVLGSTIGDLTNDGNWAAAVSGADDVIRILSSQGKILGRERGGYGGGMQSVNLGITGQGDPPEEVYLPVRLLMADISGNGRTQLIAIENKELAGKRLAALRIFQEARVVGFGWENSGLVKQWETRRIDGYIADLALTDLDGDGQKELLAAVVEKPGGAFFSKPKSHVILFSPVL